MYGFHDGLSIRQVAACLLVFHILVNCTMVKPGWQTSPEKNLKNNHPGSNPGYAECSIAIALAWELVLCLGSGSTARPSDPHSTLGFATRLSSLNGQRWKCEMSGRMSSLKTRERMSWRCAKIPGLMCLP